MIKLLSAPMALVSVLVLSLMLTACAREANTPKDRVDKALDDANIEGVSTEYDRNANVVHLQGTVESQDAKQRAEQVATQAVGTSGRVLDELKVEGMDESVADDRDDEIRNQLNAQIEQDQVLTDRDINFDVNNGVVTVKGDVRTAQEKQRVTQLVRSVPGVKDMANELEIKPKSGTRDDDMKRRDEAPDRRD